VVRFLVWVISAAFRRLICVEPYQRMSCISIIGVHIDHLVNARPASPLCVSFDLEGPTARSPRSLSSVGCITSIGVLHDGRPSVLSGS
jgi:hypothetical protein